MATDLGVQKTRPDYDAPYVEGKKRKEITYTDYPKLHIHGANAVKKFVAAFGEPEIDEETTITIKVRVCVIRKSERADDGPCDLDYGNEVELEVREIEGGKKGEVVDVSEEME